MYMYMYMYIVGEEVDSLGAVYHSLYGRGIICSLCMVIESDSLIDDSICSLSELHVP